MDAMITPDGWLVGGTVRPGPGSKHGYDYYGVAEPGPKRGLVAHSMEGSLPAAMGELDKLERRASWTFSNPKVGPLLQHYPLGFHTWASGSLQANVQFMSCEHEGGGPGNEGEPLTANQVDNLVLLIAAVAAHEGWPAFTRPASDEDRDAALWEHREMTRFRADPTACPSGRIPWATILARLAPLDLEDNMTPVPWVRAIEAGTPAAPYRTYMLIAGKLVWVATQTQERAYLDLGYILGPPVTMPLAKLKAIPIAPGSPAPDAA